MNALVPKPPASLCPEKNWNILDSLFCYFQPTFEDPRLVAKHRLIVRVFESMRTHRTVIEQINTIKNVSRYVRHNEANALSKAPFGLHCDMLCHVKVKLPMQLLQCRDAISAWSAANWEETSDFTAARISGVTWQSPIELYTVSVCTPLAAANASSTSHWSTSVIIGRDLALQQYWLVLHLPLPLRVFSLPGAYEYVRINESTPSWSSGSYLVVSCCPKVTEGTEGWRRFDLKCNESSRTHTQAQMAILTNSL